MPARRCPWEDLRDFILFLVLYSQDIQRFMTSHPDSGMRNFVGVYTVQDNLQKVTEPFLARNIIQSCFARNGPLEEMF